jgi:hypothetical protein
MRQNPRHVLLVGSVPLAPAAKVFETVARSIGDLVSRIPDGEQIGWSSAARRTFREHPALELSHKVPLNAHGADPVEIFRLKPGHRAADLTLGPYGYAENAIKSYESFRTLRDQGVIAQGTRYQATLAGPGTSAFCIQLPAEEILPISRAALAREIERMVDRIPPQDLTIQLDIAMEAEHEEWLRRPQDFDQPLHSAFHWTLEQMADSAAWLANQIPREVELGFHICSIWHHDPAAGQDNQVLVDAANAIMVRLDRPVAYLHIPIIPEHTEADFLPLADLRLTPDSELYLGLLNLGDGLEGAARRIALAEKIVPDFGVGWYCGLGRPALPDARGPSSHVHPPVPALRRATAETIDAVLDLHRAAALT